MEDKVDIGIEKEKAQFVEYISQNIAETSPECRYSVFYIWSKKNKSKFIKAIR